MLSFTLSPSSKPHNRRASLNIFPSSWNIYCMLHFQESVLTSSSVQITLHIHIHRFISQSFPGLALWLAIFTFLMPCLWIRKLLGGYVCIYTLLERGRRWISSPSLPFAVMERICKDKVDKCDLSPFPFHENWLEEPRWEMKVFSSSLAGLFHYLWGLPANFFSKELPI